MCLVKYNSQSTQTKFNRIYCIVFLQQISPGIANTGIWDHGKIFNKDFLKTVPVLEPEDIAGMVIYLLSTPLRVQVIFRES